MQWSAGEFTACSRPRYEPKLVKIAAIVVIEDGDMQDRLCLRPREWRNCCTTRQMHATRNYQRYQEHRNIGKSGVDLRTRLIRSREEDVRLHRGLDSVGFEESLNCANSEAVEVRSHHSRVFCKLGIVQMQLGAEGRSLGCC